MDGQPPLFTARFFVMCGFAFTGFHFAFALAAGLAALALPYFVAADKRLLASERAQG